MYAVCLRYSRNDDEAKDMLQDGFVKVFQNLGQFGFRGSFEGWVRKVIVNTALEKLRRESNAAPSLEDVDFQDPAVPDAIIDRLSAMDLIRLIRSLSPQYRMVFNLYAIEGYSHKEISNMLHISEGTSKSNLSRARMILQEKIKNLDKPVDQSE
ncbi:MAG: RNA polymerase sigma factor [Chlorobi bacterium]|nr:RNA polymerase sigma factor [Chlorobiota bacterium]